MSAPVRTRPSFLSTVLPVARFLTDRAMGVVKLGIAIPDADGYFRESSASTWPTHTAGTAAPSAAEPAGSWYTRTSGTIGLYQNEDGTASGWVLRVSSGADDFGTSGILADLIAQSTAAADLVIQDTSATNFIVLKGGTATSATGVKFKDSAGEVQFQVLNDGSASLPTGAMTMLGAVINSTLDQNAAIDQDTADTSGTGAAYDNLATTTSATGSAQAAHFKIKQLTNAKTAGVTSALAVAAEGLAGDTSGGTIAGIDFEAPTANGGSALYPAMLIRAGHSSTIDASAAATGENDYVMGANLASAYERRDSVGSTQRDCTTTGARRTEQIVPLEIQGGYRLQTYIIPQVEDFFGDVGATLPAAYAKDVHNSATGDYVSAAGPGVYQLATAAVSEAEAAQITGGDTLNILLSTEPIIEFRVKFTPPGATATADERLVIGLVSAHANAEDDLDATTYNLWFRVEGASLAVVVEKDDNAANVDDQASGLTVVKGQWHTFRIDCSALATPVLSMDGTAQSGGALSMSAASAQYVQPIVCYQRDAGSEINTLQVDYIAVYGKR